MNEQGNTTPGLSAGEQLLARTFESWREEFREILEDHRRDIQARLEKIEREIEKKSDKENVELIARSIRDELARHASEISALNAGLSERMATETMWKIVGLVLALGGAIGSLLGFLIHLVLRLKP
jgi:hypothetical protein